MHSHSSEGVSLVLQGLGLSKRPLLLSLGAALLSVATFVGFTAVPAQALPEVPEPSIPDVSGTSLPDSPLPSLPDPSLPSLPQNPVSYTTNEVLLASFFNSATDWSDTLYSSTDGINFDALSVAYQDANPGDPNNNESTQGPGHFTMRDPSIMYHNGFFWMLSGWNRNDGKFWPMIGVSRDGREWAYPEGQAFNQGFYDGIAMEPAPANGNDTVAPEWFKADNGDIYIVFSAGYFGSFHGRPYQDKMQPYMVKVDHLSVLGLDVSPLESRINFVPGTAVPLNLSARPAGDRIDGSIFQDGGNYYLSVKRDGHHNEIWKSANIGDPNSWNLVHDTLFSGFEGPVMTKLNGEYLLYADQLPGNGGGGTFVSKAPSPEGPWSTPQPIVTRWKDGSGMPNRHGTVTNVRDIDAKAKMYRMLIEP